MSQAAHHAKACVEQERRCAPAPYMQVPDISEAPGCEQSIPALHCGYPSYSYHGVRTHRRACASMGVHAHVRGRMHMSARVQQGCPWCPVGGRAHARPRRSLLVMQNS
eukprot:361875-Chlamydomonas_euryale.AAC.15